MTEARKKLSELAKNVRLTCEFGARLAWEKQDEWQQKADGWRCTLHYQGRRYSFDYWKGVGHHGSEPKLLECLDALLRDSSAAESTFEEWCREFGYDTDSRKAGKTYQACVRSGERLRRLLGSDYEEFLYAEIDL